MKKIFFLLWLAGTFFLLPGMLVAQNTVNRDAWSWKIDGSELVLSVKVSTHHYLYADKVKFTGGDPITVPPSIIHEDSFTGKKVPVYMGPKSFSWTFDRNKVKELSVNWQECREQNPDAPAMCYLPKKAEAIFVETAGGTEMREETPPLAKNAKPLLLPFEIIRSGSGYMAPEKFMGFLTEDESAYTHFTFAGRGLMMTILLALLGGLALNLTPCVLPLIPVNLAVIGADASEHKNPYDRVFRGLIYGAGIALTYGILGVLAVMTGTTFGQIDASWYFNAIVSLIFLFLGLAMFDVFSLDFSKYESHVRMPSAAHYSGVFLMGALSAILAGACVAPVLVAALIQASGMYSQGNYTGLFLPFLLGIGMALPWPFMAAGLSLFPKPGKWMMHVKHFLGILIILLAFYYAYVGGMILYSQVKQASESVAAAPKDSIAELNRALKESAETGKPVFLDFWATWCKACTVMDLKTFSDPEIKLELEKFIVVKFQAENPDEPQTAAVLSAFQAVGMPAYYIVKGKAE